MDRRRRPDRRLAEREARHPVLLDLDRGRRRRHDGRRRLRLRLRLRHRRGVDGDARRRRTADGAPITSGRRTSWRSSPSRRRRPRTSPRTRRGSTASPTACAIMGSLAITLCHLAAGRVDGVVSLKAARSVDIAGRCSLHEQLRSCDVDRPCRFQRDDTVDAAGCEVAERDRERPHHPAGGARRRRTARAFSETYAVVVASKERISSSSFGRSRRWARRSRSGAAAARRRPLFAGAEVEDVAKDDVVHRVAVGDRDRDREEGNAALRVQRAVDRIDDHVSQRPSPLDRRPPR